MKRGRVALLTVTVVAFAVAVVTGPQVLTASHRPAQAASATDPAGTADPPSGPPSTVQPVLAGGVPSAAGAGSSSYDPCPTRTDPLPGQGLADSQSVLVPAVPPQPLPGAAATFNPAPGDTPSSYSGTLLRPADTSAYPGPRPAVVLLHGIYGDQCQMWWLASYLAGAGYVALILTSPTPSAPDASYGVAIDATRSAVHLLTTPVENPYAFATDPNDLAIGGWSEGSVAASVVQGLPGMGAVRTIVALDDLRGSFLGDSGAPLTFCTPPVRAPITPRVPALGFASDEPCDLEPGDTNPDVKLSGFERWLDAHVPAVELPLAGYSHFDYDLPGPRLAPVGELILNWLNVWLEGASADLGAFFSCTFSGVPLAGALSATYHAAAYLPLYGIETEDYAQQLTARCGQPLSVVGTTPFP